MGQPEKTNANKWSEAISKELNIYTERFIDTPFVSKGGMSCHKKKCDRIFVFSGLAVEFKYVVGRSFNFKKWREDKRTRHQYRDLVDIAKNWNMVSVVKIYFKVAGKRDLRKKWFYILECGVVDKVDYTEMRDVKELEALMKKECK